jgi:CheY-like chemotaxis protein
VYGFVKQSGGHLKIYSEPGCGTTVKLYLPRAGASPNTGMDQSEPGGHAVETILLVEDDANIRKLVAAMLNSLSYKVVDAEDGPSALTALASHGKPDMLLTDMVLPRGMNGSDLARQAREQYPALKVLFMSGYTNNALLSSGAQEKSARLLSKPFRRQELARAVRAVLDE